MKKKIVVGATVAALVLTVGATSVFAAGARQDKNNPAGSGQNYVDTDGDGVCDLKPSGMGQQDGNGRQAGMRRGQNN